MYRTTSALCAIALAATLTAHADFSYSKTQKVTGGSMAAMAGNTANRDGKSYFKGEKIAEVNGDSTILIDFGAQLDGYCSDLTRTVVVGRADDRQREVYAVVEAAQRRAREGVRAGMTGREADALAREVIAQRGYGEAFGHSLGHGLGLEVHEAPRLSPTAEGVLPAGAVVTIEPGIYLPGWGGVRLEDDVLLAPDGPECLSDGRTALIEV